MTFPLKHLRRFAACAAVLAVASTLVAIAGPVFHWVTDYGVQSEALHLHRMSPADRAAAIADAKPAKEGIAPSEAPSAPLATVAAAPGRLQTDQVPSPKFTTVGVRLSTATSAPILLRWQGSSGWSDWHELDVEADAGPDRGTAEAAKAAHAGVETEPLWVGDGAAYQVNLPPGSSSSDPQILLVSATGHHLEAQSQPATAGAATPNEPPIHTRAEWGAAAPTGPIGVAPDLKMAVVHHSDTGNDYTPAQVPGIIRSVQAFHIEGRDWNDIGYNFIVDRFGRIWEGRQGSIDQLSIGAHAEGFNTSTIGVMVLGNYSATGPSAAALSGVAQVIAWKFANYGVDPDSSVAYTSGGSLSIPAGQTRTFPRIVGHRDVGATSCPGNYLYAQLPVVRALVDQKFPAAASPVGTVDVESAGPSSLLVAGWAIDPSAPDPIEVHVYIDGQGTNLGPASIPRPDVGAVFPASGPNHGYSHVFSGLSPGTHQVCVFAINIGPGNNTLISCRDMVVPSGSPGGVIDQAVMGPNGALTVSGWALDPDTTAPIDVNVYVDGVGTDIGQAAISRTDLTAYFPLYGTQHGFTWSTHVAPTAHQVCVYAINTGPGSNSLLGCRQVTPPTGSPVGSVDVAVGGPDGTAYIAGWTLDPDTASPIEAHVYIDGHGTNLGPTPVARADIAAAYPGFGPTHGFTDSVTGLAPGQHQVCVFGINVGPGSNTLLRCVTITVPSGSPIGSIDVAAAAGAGAVNVAGWAIDPDTAGSIQVHVYIDGQGTNTGLATIPRPDVAAAFPGYGADHGYNWTSGPLSPGAHQVCVFGINVGVGTNTLYGCRTVTV